MNKFKDVVIFGVLTIIFLIGSFVIFGVSTIKDKAYEQKIKELEIDIAVYEFYEAWNDDYLYIAIDRAEIELELEYQNMLWEKELEIRTLELRLELYDKELPDVSLTSYDFYLATVATRERSGDDYYYYIIIDDIGDGGYFLSKELFSVNEKVLLAVKDEVITLIDFE